MRPVGLALAAGFSGIRDDLAGSVMLVFQPAEETATGARAMLDDGAFAKRKPDAIFAYHTAPLEVGQVAGTPGTLLPGRDAVQVEIRGDGDLRETANKVRRVLSASATEGSNEPSRPVGDAFVRVDGARASQDGDGWAVRATLTTAGREASSRAREQIETSLAALERDGLTLSLRYRERFVAGADNEALRGETDVRIMCAGAPVSPGDFVAADADGVVIIPKALAHIVAERSLAVLRKEDAIKVRLAKGETTAEIFNVSV